VSSKTEFVRLETEVYRHMLVAGCGTVDTYNIIHGILKQSLKIKKVTFLIIMKIIPSSPLAYIYISINMIRYLRFTPEIPII